MKNRMIEYPHPVLSEYTQDYVNSYFGIEVKSFQDDDDEIVVEISCKMECKGLKDLIDIGDTKAIVRVTCSTTSLRKLYDLSITESTYIRIEKKDIRKEIDLQAMIVTTKALDHFRLPEFNSAYFGNTEFKIRKGDLLADGLGVKIKLDTMAEKSLPGIVQLRRGGSKITEMNIHFAEVDENSADLKDYIVITLPDADYNNYESLCKKKHMKNSIERFLQASIILPVITEAVGKLRMEESIAEEYTHYNGTVWADSIYDSLHKHEIYDLESNQMSDFEIANILLGNVTSDAISSLVKKINEWTILREDEITL